MKKLLILAASVLAANTALAQEKLTVLLDWFINPDHGTLMWLKSWACLPTLG